MSHRLVLYSGPSCSLCEDARSMLDRIGHPYEVAQDPRYAERIPVIEIDGRIVTEGRVGERAVRRALRASGVSPGRTRRRPPAAPAALIALALAIGSCASGPTVAVRESPGVGVVLRIDRLGYAPGDRPLVTIENRSTARIMYNTCWAFLDLERREGESWTRLEVSLGPGGMSGCTAEGRILPQDGQDDEQVYLADDLEPGTYRITHEVEIDGERVVLATEAFEVS